MPGLLIQMPASDEPTARMRRRLVARVGELPVAAALALGAQLPWSVAYAQGQPGTVITPLSGAASTQTTVSQVQAGVTHVTTATVRDGNAFNHFSSFQVGGGDTVKMVVPQGANWLVNVVRDQQVRVDGHLLGKVGAADGQTGGNLLFIDTHGFAVGPGGRVDAGRLVFAAPSATFVDQLLTSGAGAGAQQIEAVLGGQFDRSTTGEVRIDGDIHTSDAVLVMAGGGQGASAAVQLHGRVTVDGLRMGVSVNLGPLHAMTPVVERDGVIEITTPGDILLNGKLLADGSHWSQAGAVKVVAGGDIDLGSNSQVSASAAQGTGGAGGLVSLFAENSARNATGAVLAARGDGLGAGGFIELSAAKSVSVGGLTMDAGSDSGRAGLAYIDPEDLVLTDNLYTNGSLALLEATRSVTINAGVVINTRQVGATTTEAAGLLSSNPNSASTGDSGDIVLTAPAITVQAGAALDASAVNDTGNTFADGDITLTAQASANWVTLLGLANADASVDVAGTLTGGNVTLEAGIESSAVYDGISAALTEKGLSLLSDHFESPLALSLAYTEATGNATVNVRDTAVLDATKDLSITAMADRSAGAELQVEGSSKANLSAGFARIAGSAAVDIASGAMLSAEENIKLVAASKTTVGMTSAAAGETDEQSGAANVASVVFAGSMSDVTTRVSVASGAVLTSGGSTDVQAFHSGNYETSAEVTVYGGGTAGVVGALSLQTSTTTAAVDGTVNAGGDVRVMAMNATAKNAISATAETATKAPDEELELPQSLELSTDDAKTQLQTGFLSMAEELSATSEEASGGSATPAESKPSALKLAGALTWSESDHTTRATLGAGARVSAGGHAVVDAQTLVGQVQSVALSEAASETEGKDASKVALSVAINYADHAVTTRAEVGVGAEVTAGHVAVNASTDVPEFYTNGLPLDWSSFSSAYANLMGGSDFLLDGFNSRVGSTAAGKTLAAAGAVNLTFMTHDTRAWVNAGAKITTNVHDGLPWSYDLREVNFDSDLVEMLIGEVPYTLDKDLGVMGDFVTDSRQSPLGDPLDEINFTRQFDGSTVVRAETHVQTLHHAGGDAPEAGASGTSVGGTFTMVDRRNTTMAGIADQAEVITHRLDVAAETDDWLLSVSPTSGGGAGIAANGMASYNKLSQTTRASISREALVTAPMVNVDAQLSLGVLAVTGAVTKSENSGVGIGVALNDMTGDTRAYIGDNDSDGGGLDTTEGAVGYVRTRQLGVNARTDGMIVAVGVAGAVAGQEPQPETPDSTGKNMADGVAAGSAEEQAQLDGSEATMAPLEEGAAPAKGEGTDAAAAEEPAANKPPSFSIAGAGAIVTNFSDLDTTALLEGALVSGIGSGTNSVAVQALSDLTQVSVAGGGALSLAKNTSTTFTAAVAGAVAVQKSDDDTTARIVNSTLSDLADQSGSLVLRALKSGERTAVATGISANLSKGSTTSLSLVGSASVTTSSDDTVAAMDDSNVSGDAAAPTALGVQVLAYDRSRIGAGGGALSVSTGKGSAGVGAAISIVNAKGSTQARVDDGSIEQAHDLAVLALSSQKVVGVAAVGGLQTSSDASSLGQLMGSFVFNHIDTTVSAGVTGGAVVNLTGDLALQAGGAPTDAALDALLGSARSSEVTDYEMASTSNGYTEEFKSAVGGESIVGVAGTLSVTLGGQSSSLGLSYVHNDIQTTYDADLDGTANVAGDVDVTAVSRADIVGVSAGVGASKGKFSGMGSASVNLIGQRTEASVSGGSVSGASLDVTSSTTGNTFGLAGNLSFAVGGGQGSAMGAAVAVSQTGTRTYDGGGESISTRAAGNAARIDNATVDVGSGSVQVLASNVSDLQSVAASGAAADGNVGFAGTVTVNEIGDVTDARIGASTVTAGTVMVQAGEGQGATSAQIRSLAGGVSASKGYSGALALGFNTIGSTRSAQVLSSTLHASGSVSVLADAAATIQTLSVTLAGGKDYALAGSSSTNVLNGSTLANVEYTTLDGAATGLTLGASQSGRIESLAGAVSAGGTGAIGGAVAVNLMGEGENNFQVTARLKDSVLAAPVAVSLDASLSGSIGSVAASGSGAGTAAINGSVTANTIEADVVAEVVGGTQSVSGGAFSVQAVQDASIDSLAGTISGAGTAAVGAAVSVNEIGGKVLARVQNYTLRATGAVAVDASSSSTIRSIAAGASGGGTAALAGSNTTNAITSTVQAQMDSVTQAAASASLRVQALDSSTIQSFAGSVAGGGMAAGGAAFALNFLGRTATDADSSKIVKAEVLNSALNSAGAVQVKAVSTSTIESMGLAVGASGNVAVTGSNTTNLLEDEIEASWSGGSLSGTATSLTVQADDAATVHTLAGNVSGSGSGAVGAAIAVNQVGSQVRATLASMTLSAAPVVAVDADVRGEIKSVAASGAASAGASVNGSFTTNELTTSVQAQVTGLNQTTSGGAFMVSADNDADIFSLAGTVSGSGTAAVGAAVSVNDIGGDVTARLAYSTLRAAGSVGVQATTSGTIQSVAAGMSGGGSVALAGSNTTNGITSTVLAQMDGVTMAVNAASTAVLARDTSTIQSFAGTVAGGGVAGGGAALALNFLGRTATDAESSKVVKAEVTGSTVRSSGAVQVQAYSTSTIESIGVAAGASGTVSISGSNSTNLLEDEITASWSASDLTTDNTLTVDAWQASQINSLAGNVSGSMGAAVGAALAVNRIGTATNARLLGDTNANYSNNSGRWTLFADDVLLSAESDNQINTIAVGMSAGSAGVQGSVAVSVIDAQTHAQLGDDGHVTNVIAGDTVAVMAHSRDRIRALAGAVGLGATGVGAAGGVLTNIISSDTSAGINGLDSHVNAYANGTGLTVRDDALVSKPDLMSVTELSDSVLDGAAFATRNVKGLAVQATSIQQIGALTAVAGGGALGAAGAAVNVDQIAGSTRAYIDSARFINDAAGAHAGQTTDVMAANHAMIASSATALAIGATGVAGSVGTEIVERSTRAEVVDSAIVNAQGAATVKAVSTNAVAQIAAGGAGGAAFGVAGSGDIVMLKGQTVALVDSATVKADSIAVVADGTNASNLVAGTVSYAGVPGGVGVGLSFTVNVSGSTVRALVDDSRLAADGAVVVDADNRTESLSVSASAAAGGSFGVAVGASVSVMEGATEAAVTGSTTIGKRTLATGLLASAGDAPVTLNLASAYDLVGTDNQSAVRLRLSDVSGQVSSDTAVVTLTDGDTTVSAVRQSDGSYSADVSTLADGLLLAQMVITEGGVQKVATTTLSKSTGINASETDPAVASLPAAQTRIDTLSSFSQVDARNQDAVVFVLKSDFGPTADNTASVIVSDGTRQVAAVLNDDGSYTADVRSLGDGVLTALVTTPEGGTETARVTFLKNAGAASLSVTADETVLLNHNAGQVGAGGVAGVGASANVVVGKSSVDATLSAAIVTVSDELTVAAERSADIDMITATGGGGGIAGVSGAVGVLVFGSAPDSNANAELNGDGGSLAQISGATKADRAQGTGAGLSASEAAALNSSGSYDTQAAYASATGGHRTSATVTAPSILAGSLAVRSLDRTGVDNNAGAVALGGAAGVSAGVAITQVGGANHAGVSAGSLIVADTVSIESGMRTPVSGEPAIESRAIAGAGGFVGVGAAVSVASNATASSASVSGKVEAGGEVSVRALDQTSLLSEAYGATAGALSVGVVTATASQTGSVATHVGGSVAGEGFRALAERDASTEAEAYGGVSGVIAGSGAAATASDAGTVSLVLASGTDIDAGKGDIALSAKSNPSADTRAIGVSVAAGAAVGVSVALSEVKTDVNVTAVGPVFLQGADMLVSAVLGSGDGAVSAEAVAGGGGLLLGLQGAGASSTNQGRSSVNLGNVILSASGDVGISANDAMSASAASTGVGVGFVGAGVAVASAESDSTVSTQIGALGGTVAGHLTISARGDEVVDADAVAGSGGVVAGAGAEATVNHQQDVSATMSTAEAGLSIAGTTTISADRKVRYDSQTETVNASAFGGSGAVTQATLTGAVTAGLGNGSTLTGGQLRLLATNDVERSNLSAVSAEGGGGGVIAGAGADVSTVINGTATAELGDDVNLVLGGTSAGLLELRAYNQLRGSSLGRLDLGGAIPIALVDTEIRSTANAYATMGERNNIYVAGEVFANAMSYVDIEANTITKTYGAAAGAQGDALAQANVNNVVTVGAGTHLVGEGAMSLLAGQDRDYWRNKSFVTARADLFNHSAIPVSINPDAEAELNLNNSVNLLGNAVRSGGTIQLGGIEGTYVVEGKGKVSDWTRDVGELVGISSEYGSSKKSLNANTVVNGTIEAGYGNKQVIVINADGSLDASKTLGNIRYSIGTEDLAATGAAYLDTLYNQLKNYGDVPEVKAFVEAEIAFYLETLVREGFATVETDPNTGITSIVAQERVPGTFLTVQNVRAGSGNVELFGNNVSGKADLIARADSEILIDNHSPMNIRVKDLVIDSSGGFVKYNGVYLTDSAGADIATFNRDSQTGLEIKVDSIDTRGGGAGEELPTLQVINRYQSTGQLSDHAVIAVAPDGSSADLRQDQLRAPEIRVNGLVYNKLGPIILTNTAGSISVTQEDPIYTPLVDGLEVQINAGKNIVLSSPSVSQSVGGSPENLYAVAYNDDQQRKLDNMGVVRCGTARAGTPSATSFSADCQRDGAGGIFANGGVYLGARYLNINGTIQSGQPDYKVTLTDAGIGATIRNWESLWTANRGTYLAQGRSSLVQVAGRLPSDSEAEINKQFANGSITLAQRDDRIAQMDARRAQPVVYYDAEDNRLKVAATEVTGGLVEVVGSVINTGGGVIRAMDGYARFDIDNQTSYGLDLLGLDTGGDSGVVRITDLSRPVTTNGRVTAYEVTTYQRDADTGQYTATTTAGRGSTILGTPQSVSAANDASRPELRASFTYQPVQDSTYVWSAGYEYGQEKRYWYQKSSLFGLINLGSVSWNSINTITKNSTAMPEGIYVTTAAAPAQNFSMSSDTYTTDAEKQIYYRSWKKCGFLCIKKTFYVDYRTEVGKKDVFTQRVRADHPIDIELVGYDSGLIDVTSKGDIRIAGAITNDSGLVSLDSAQGSISQLSGGTAVSGNDLRFYAAQGIGDEGAPVNVMTGAGSFTAQSDTGNVSFQSLGGALRVNEVSTTGKVWLLGDEDIVGVNPNAVHVRGSRIEMSAPRGGIGVFNADGTVKSTLNIQTEDSSGGGITAHAARGIALKQDTGNLWVDQVASSGGDVYIETAGDLIDNNRNESRDVRTEEELLALWSAASLQGSSAEESLQRTLANTRAQYRRYWSLRNAVVDAIDPVSGAVTAFSADPYDPQTYAFAFTANELTQLSQSGLSAEQIGSLEAARTQELKDLHVLYGATQYQLDPQLIIAEVNTANAAQGLQAVDALSTWSDAELRSPLPKAIFSKSSTDTQTRIEEPNVVGNRVVLRPGGKIGRDDGAVTIDLLKPGGLTTEDQLTIMSAESDDMTLDKTNWQLKVVKKDTFNVLSNKLNVQSSGFVYLGADETEAYPNGGNANLEQVVGNGEIRIKVSGSILNASEAATSVIQGHKAILEAASGSIGSSVKPLTLTLTGGGDLSAATLVARGKEGIWIHQSGDIRMADLYSPASVNLTAEGAIIDARGSERTRSIEGGEATLVALGGSVGTSANPIVAKMSSSGGVNAVTPVGYSVYLQGAETGLSVKNIQSGLDIELYAPSGDLVANGSSSALGRIDVQSENDFNMASGSRFEAVTGDIAVSADDVGLSQLDASRAVTVVAQGTITDTHEDDLNINAAGRSVTLSGVGGIGTSAKPIDVLTRDRSRVVGISREGGVYLGADFGDLRVAQVSAKRNVQLGSAGDILDERGVLNQAVEGENITFFAGGNVGMAASPFTFKTSPGGQVQAYSDNASGFLKSVGAFHLSGGGVEDQLVLDGSAAGIQLSGKVSTGNGLVLSSGSRSIWIDSDAELVNGTGRVLLQGNTIGMSDGALLDGGTGSVVFSAVNDISLTGVQTANDTNNAIVVASTRGRVLDGGDLNPYDLRVTGLNGGISVAAYGSVGNGTLSSSAAGYALDTDAPTLEVLSRTSSVNLSQEGSTKDLHITARTDVDLTGQESLMGSKIAALTGNARVSSLQGKISINALTAAGHVNVQSDLDVRLDSVGAKRDVTLQSRKGGVSATSLSAGGSLALMAAGSIDVSRAKSTGNLSAEADGGLVLGQLVSARGAIDLSSAAAAGVEFESLSAYQGVQINALGEVRGSVVTSKLGALSARSSGAGLYVDSASAYGELSLSSAGDMVLGTYGSKRSKVALMSAGQLQAAAGSAYGDLSIHSDESISLGNTVSSRGGVTVAAESGTLTAGVISALSDINLMVQGNVTGDSLTSKGSAVSAVSQLGDIAANRVAARTGLRMQAQTQLQLSGFRVSAGGANFSSGSSMSLGSGLATGAIDVWAAGSGTIGTLVSSGSSISAVSAGSGLIFSSIKAANGIGLVATAPVGSGPYANYAIHGKTLDAGRGGISAIAVQGDIHLDRLMATQQSAVDARNGDLKVASVKFPNVTAFVGTATGQREVPTGY